MADDDQELKIINPKPKKSKKLLDNFTGCVLLMTSESGLRGIEGMSP